MAPRKKPRPIGVAVFRSGDQWVGFVTVGTKRNGTPDRRKRSGKTCPQCAPADVTEPTCGCRERVEDKIRELEDKAAANAAGKPGRIPTVEEWFTTWLTDIAPYDGRKPLRPSTLESYRSDCRNWIFPHLGGIRLHMLDTDDLDRLYKAMRKAKMASSHILKVHAIIRRALSVAIQRDKVGRNVAQQIDNPGSAAPRNPHKALTREQAEAVLAVIEARRNALRWKVGLAIGPRQGEALGLHWEQVDMDEGVVDTARQVQRRTWRHGCDDPHGCGYRTDSDKPPLHRVARPACPGAGATHDRYHKAGCPPPKSGCRPKCDKHASSCPQREGGGLVITRSKTMADDESTHPVALPAALVPQLREHRDTQDKEREAAGELWEEHGLVFCQPSGRPIDPRRDWGEWQEILAEAGLAGAGTHAQRHTAATMLLELGEDLAVVQEVLGHADVRSTRGYTKVSIGLTRRAADRMNALFAPKPAKPEESNPESAGGEGDVDGSATDHATEPDPKIE